MYAVSKPPSSYAIYSKKGRVAAPPNNKSESSLDYQHKEFVGKKTGEASGIVEMSGPRPTFQFNSHHKSQILRYNPEPLPPHHEEIIKYIDSSWKSVLRDHEFERPSSINKKVPRVIYYKDNSELIDFQPFDLDNFWGQKYIQTITKSK